MRRALLLVIALPALAGWEILQSTDEDVARGNRHYDAGAFQAAIDAYEKALGQGGDAAKIHFDIGTALYKLGEPLEPGNERTVLLDRAEAEFRLGADTSDGRLKASAYHNLGNAHFVRERYRDAIDAYKRALRANPESDDARYNLELALRKLERDEPPQSQPQPDPGQPQGDPDQGQGGDPDPDQGNDPDDNQADQNQPQGQGADQQDREGGTDPNDPAQQPDPDQASPGQNRTPDSADPQQNDPNNTQQNEAGQNPGNSEPGSPDRRGKSNSPSQQPAPDPRSESERKLDELERRSLELRKQKLKNGESSKGNWRAKPGKDW